MGRKVRPFLDRLDDFVISEPNCGCWFWVAGKEPRNGYNIITIGNKHKLVHRVSYEHFKGPIPPGMMVCHSCDMRSCINPDHLFLGTGKDNQQDSIKKGRRPYQKGSANYAAKLTEDQVSDIKTGRLRQSEFARLYNISPVTVCNIVKGRVWTHI